MRYRRIGYLLESLTQSFLIELFLTHYSHMQCRIQAIDHNLFGVQKLLFHKILIHQQIYPLKLHQTVDLGKGLYHFHHKVMLLVLQLILVYHTEVLTLLKNSLVELQLLDFCWQLQFPQHGGLEVVQADFRRWARSDSDYDGL